jgi:hypothetical protein
MKFTYGSDFEMMIRNRNYRKPEKKSGFFTSSNTSKNKWRCNWS